jgi:hypothetical protein
MNLNLNDIPTVDAAEIRRFLEIITSHAVSVINGKNPPACCSSFA